MLSVDVNNRILKLAPKFNVSDFAPDTFDKLCSNIGRLVVWDGASDSTIYGDPNVNYAFRAWHDSLHIKLNADFSFIGETIVALEQARLMQGDFMGDIIMIEVVEQAKYLNKFGHFPVDQLKFVLDMIRS